MMISQASSITLPYRYAMVYNLGFGVWNDICMCLPKSPRSNFADDHSGKIEKGPFHAAV